MKKVLSFLKNSIPGVLTAVALSFIVWKVTGYNLYILLAAFTVGYFVVGTAVEFLTIYFSESIIRRPRRTETVKPDSKGAIDLASKGEVDFITDGKLFEADEQEPEDEPENDEDQTDEETDAGESGSGQ